MLSQLSTLRLSGRTLLLEVSYAGLFLNICFVSYGVWKLRLQSFMLAVVRIGLLETKKENKSILELRYSVLQLTASSYSYGCVGRYNGDSTSFVSVL
jgi:uncharacterized membrane protein